MILTLNTNFVNKFCEFDRISDPIEFWGLSSSRKIEELRESILNEGLKIPLELWVYGLKALLVEGNHRIAVLKMLGINKIKVDVKFKLVIKNAYKERINRFVNLF